VDSGVTSVPRSWTAFSRSGRAPCSLSVGLVWMCCYGCLVNLTDPIPRLRPWPGNGASMICPILSYPHRVLYSAVNQMPSYSFIFLASSFHIRYVGKLVTSKNLYLQSIGKEVQVDWSHFIPQHSKEPGARTVRRCREIYL